jgi:type II secretory pathway component PulF
MSVFNKALAVLVGGVVAGSVAYSGHVAAQFRKIFLDFGSELPAFTRLIVETPFLSYLAAAAILGALAARAIWVAKSKGRAVLLAASVATAIIVWWIGFAVTVMSPMICTIYDLAEAEPETKGEQANPADSR